MKKADRKGFDGGDACIWTGSGGSALSRYLVMLMVFCLLLTGTALFQTSAAADGVETNDNLINGNLPCNGGRVWMGSNDTPWMIIGASSDNYLLISMLPLSSNITAFEAIAYPNELLSGSFFMDAEKQAMPLTTKVETDVYTAEIGQSFNPKSLEREQIFILSAAEAETYFSSDTDRCPCSWWLRSSVNDSPYRGYVTIKGFVFSATFTDTVDFSGNPLGVRPAFQLDRTRVVCESDDTNGKPSANIGFSAWTEPPMSTSRKLTLVDNSRSGFTARASSTTVLPGEQLTLTYSGAITGGSEYVSAILRDSKGTALYYASLTPDSSGAGIWNLDLPSDLGGTYTLSVFSEHRNGNKRSDFASAPVEITLEVPVCTVTYQDSDGTLIQTISDVTYGMEWEHTISNPEKAPDTQYHYSFTGWENSNNSMIITQDTVFTAAYTAQAHRWTYNDTCTQRTCRDCEYAEMGEFFGHTVEITAGSTVWEAGDTYSATGNVTISDRVTVNGHVTLLLEEGATLTCAKGISVFTGNSLTINGSGTLIANASGYPNAAGIGGSSLGDDPASGVITINGGTVKATGGKYGAGIGGGMCGNCNNVTINGGNVTAAGGTRGAGIGGGGNNFKAGTYGNVDTIIVNGGVVLATGGETGSGIGGGGGDAPSSGLPWGSGGNASTVRGGNVEAIIINGGQVTARSPSGAGIGPDRYYGSGNVMLGWNDESDFIEASSYSGTVAFREGRLFVLNNTHTLATLDNISDSRLVPFVFNDGTIDFILPSSLTTVEAEAFAGITASIVDIPANCQSIGDHAFQNCPNLIQIRIPSGCELGENVFDGCALVYMFSTPGSPAEAYCNDPAHSNCIFVAVE